MLSFKDWCGKIASHLTASDSFDIFKEEHVGPYHLLPAVWQAMTPDEKKTAVSIVEKHSGAWNVECILELRDTLGLSMGDVPSIQVAVWRAMENPGDLERGMEDISTSNRAQLPTEIEEVENGRRKATDGLTMFQDIPEGMVGEELFDHMVHRRMIKYADKPGEHKISEHLCILPPIAGRSRPQKDIFKVDYLSVCEANIVSGLES